MRPKRIRTLTVMPFRASNHARRDRGLLVRRQIRARRFKSLDLMIGRPVWGEFVLGRPIIWFKVAPMVQPIARDRDKRWE